MCFAFYLAKQIVNPKFISLEKTINLSKEHDLYFDFDKTKKEKIIIKSFDGYLINGYFIENSTPSNNYVIISHGHNWSKAGSLKFMNLYLKLGFNCIIYDVRGHGENKSSHITMGNLESKDLIEITYYLRRKYGTNIYLGLHGESMGASLSIMALKYKPDVQFVVADCGYADFSHVLSYSYKLKHIPHIYVWATGLASRLRYGFNVTKVKPIDALIGNKVPICYFHGKKDNYVPYLESTLMYDHTSSYRELHLFNDSKHLMCLRDEPVKYEKTLVHFLQKIREFHFDITN